MGHHVSLSLLQFTTSAVYQTSAVKRTIGIHARAFLTWDVQKPRNHQGNLEVFSSILVAVVFNQRTISNVNYFLEGQPQTKWRSHSKVFRCWCKCPQLAWLRAEGTFLVSDRIRSQACRFLYQVPPDLTFIVMSCWHQLLFWNFSHGT